MLKQDVECRKRLRTFWAKTKSPGVAEDKPNVAAPVEVAELECWVLSGQFLAWSVFDFKWGWSKCAGNLM